MIVWVLEFEKIDRMWPENTLLGISIMLVIFPVIRFLAGLILFLATKSTTCPGGTNHPIMIPMQKIMASILDYPSTSQDPNFHDRLPCFFNKAVGVPITDNVTVLWLDSCFAMLRHVAIREIGCLTLDDKVLICEVLICAVSFMQETLKSRKLSLHGSSLGPFFLQPKT